MDVYDNGRVYNDTVTVFEATLKENKIKRDEWIHQQVVKDYGFELTKEILAQFDLLMHKQHYEDRGNWLRDKIKHFLQA